ncbi:MAG TPA: DUF3810 domain-containing protein [Sphingobacterium sp.]|nr:DUF3810 domain-containing protein [Sphingobacterium sp.]
MERLFGGKNKFYLWVIAICLFFQLLLPVLQNHPEWVEQYYSRGFYLKFSYLSIVLFSWLPFSVGDLCYAVVVVMLLILSYQLCREAFRKKWQRLIRRLFQLLALVLFLYSYFYVNWGLNYFRVPVAEQMSLDTKSINREEYLQILEKYIFITNNIRENLELERLSKKGVRKDLEDTMRQDTLFQSILSYSQIHGKAPISSTAASYLAVSGYFNPFTLEVHVNQRIPLASYPFVTVHELVHQMGIGFEDECNFIAFRKLMDHEDDWYRYSAYYEAVQYLMYPLYREMELFAHYKSMLSPKVQKDLEEERAFWREYSGWINRLSGIFYNEYLKLNNQPEGMERYSMMARLVVAWEKSHEK